MEGYEEMAELMAIDTVMLRLKPFSKKFGGGREVERFIRDKSCPGGCCLLGLVKRRAVRI